MRMQCDNCKKLDTEACPADLRGRMISAEERSRQW